MNTTASPANRIEPLRFRGHIPGLDVLRGVAISMVVLFHGVDGRASYQSFDGAARVLVYLTSWGAAGVHLFYVLSGFLITGIIIDGGSDQSFFRKFYKRRACRILPAYFLLLVLLKATGHVSWNFVLAAVLFIANMAGMVGASSNEYGPMWSLAVEEQFYLVWPWIARNRPLRPLSLWILVYCLASLVALGALARFAPQVDFRYKLWGNAPWLLTGALIAICLRSGALNRANINRWTLTLMVGAGVTSPIVAFMDSGLAVDPWFTPLYRLPFVLLFAALVLRMIARNDGRTPDETRGAARVLAFLGYISYGLYLIHQFVFEVFDHVTVDTWLMPSLHRIGPLWIGCAACFAISTLVAFLSRRYFESIFLRK
jgi:peptidoglycan/LPS O-acetylase OafA/YrhL